MAMKKFTARLAIISVVFCVSLALGLSGANAQSKPVVRVSGQPTMHGMPTWQIMEQGTKDLPIDLTYTLFPSGAPQVEALAAGQWDVEPSDRTHDDVQHSLWALMIGISNDESETNDLWVRADSPLLKTKGANPKYPNLYGTSADWKGKKILCTTVSTGHYALSSTLKALGLTDKDVQIIQIEQGQAVAAFASGQGDILQMWAPFSYIAEGRAGKKPPPAHAPVS